MSKVDICKALSSRSRWSILDILVGKTLTVDEIAERTQLKPITVRHHIQALERIGLVESREERGRIGRPKTYYQISQKGVVIEFPKRQYLLLADILIQSLLAELGKEKITKILRNTGLKEGRKIAKELKEKHNIREWSVENFVEYFIEEFSRSVGFQPLVLRVSINEIQFRVHNCIFCDLAIKYPTLICDELDSGFWESICKETIGNAKITHMKCIASGDKYCEYLIKKM